MHLHRIVELTGGLERNLTECGVDHSGYVRTAVDSTQGDWAQAFAGTSADFSRLFPSRVLVPWVYPFSLPLEITSGCARTRRCRMCSLADVSKPQPGLSEVKGRIAEWARTIGRLLHGTQSVFLARNNLFSVPFGFLVECLRSIKSQANLEAMNAGSLPQVREYTLQRVQHWGNAAKLSAFGYVPDVLAYSVQELAQLNENGLETVFLALETGSDRLRQAVLGKDYSAAEVRLAMERLLEAGIAVNVLVMLGIGGTDSDEHVAETAKAMASFADAAERFRTPGFFRPLVFYISPLDPRFAPSALRRHATVSSVEESLRELPKLGTLKRREWDGDSAVPSTSRGFELQGGREVQIFPYSFGSALI